MSIYQKIRVPACRFEEKNFKIVFQFSGGKYEVGDQTEKANSSDFSFEFVKQTRVAMITRTSVYLHQRRYRFKCQVPRIFWGEVALNVPLIRLQARPVEALYVSVSI